MDIFEKVKSTVNLRTVAEHYGLIFKHNTALCPVHNEKTGSLKLYHDHFYCFGCGEHGDVIKLTEKPLGLSPIDSARRLAADFNVLIHDNFKPGEQTRNKASPQKIVTYKERENRAYRLLADYCKYLEDCRIRYAPHSPKEHPHPLFVHSLHNLEISIYYQKILIFRIQNERTEFIKENNNKSAGIFSVIESNYTIIFFNSVLYKSSKLCYNIIRKFSMEADESYEIDT